MEEKGRKEEPAGKGPGEKKPSTMEIILSDKIFSIVVIGAITLVAALATGALIGLLTFKKAAREEPPPKTAVTVPAPVPVFQGASTVVRQEARPVQAGKAEAPARRKEVPVAKKVGKKPVKTRKVSVAHRGGSVPGENIGRIMEEAKAGDADAQYRLGVMYAKGIGVAKDRKESMRWYKRAASQGHVKAREALEFIYE